MTRLARTSWTALSLLLSTAAPAIAHAQLPPGYEGPEGANRAIDERLAAAEAERVGGNCVASAGYYNAANRYLATIRANGLLSGEALGNAERRIEEWTRRPCPPRAEPPPQPPAPPPVEVIPPVQQPPARPGAQPGDNPEIDAALRAMEAAKAICDRPAWEAARARAITEIERRLEIETDRALRLRLNQLKNDLRYYGIGCGDPPQQPPVERLPPAGEPVPPDGPPPDPRAAEDADLARLALAMEVAISRCNRDAFERARDAIIAAIDRRLETELDRDARTRLNMRKNELRRRAFPQPCGTPDHKARDAVINIFYGPIYVTPVGTGVQRAGAVGVEETYADEGRDRFDGYAIDAAVSRGRLTVGGGYQHAEGDRAFTTNAGPTGGSGVPFGQTSDIGTTGFFVPAESSGTTEDEFDSWYIEGMWELFGGGDEDDFDDERGIRLSESGEIVISGYVRYQYDLTEHRSSIGASGVTGAGTAFSYSQTRRQEVEQSNVQLGLDLRARFPLSPSVALGLFGRAGGYHAKANMTSFENDRASFGPPETRDFDQTNLDEASGIGFAGRTEGPLEFKVGDGANLAAIARFDYRSRDYVVRNPVDGDEVLAGGRTRLEKADRFNFSVGIGLRIGF